VWTFVRTVMLPMGSRCSTHLFSKEKEMAGSSVDTSIAAMQQAAADNARLTATSTSVNAQIQGASTTAQTVNAASTAGTEVAKGVASGMERAAQKAN
jgi:hypothetical protein